MRIDGRKIAAETLGACALRVQKLGFAPVFIDVLVGTDPVQLSYVNIKGKMAKRIGIDFRLEQLPEHITTEALIESITALAATPNVCGLIVQLPLPSNIDTVAVLRAIPRSIDVDCISPDQSRGFYQGDQTLVPPTASAILTLLDSLQQDLHEKKIVVVGQGPLVGKPVTFLLHRRGYDVFGADRSTPDLQKLLQTADVIIAGTGRAGLITGESIKPGAIVIDAGTAETDGGIVGDVDTASVEPVASFVSPVPGGVGPVTVSELLANVVTVAESVAQK